MIRTYRKLRQLSSFEDRYEYLRIAGKVGMDTCGYDRYRNQLLCTSGRWRRTRDGIITRDNGCDLGIKGHEIYGKIIIHHMNPITIEDVELDREEIYDPNLLITTSSNTHQAIHYGDKSLLPRLPLVRTKNDTCPWL